MTAAAGTRSRAYRQQGQLSLIWHELRRSPAGMLGLALLALLILLSLLAPVIAPYNPTSLDYDHLLSPPSPLHLWGTDDMGRDILSRVLWGGRESLRVALLAVGIGIGGGTVVGLVSGFYGGIVDVLIQRIVEVLMAFPSILLVLSIVAALGPGLGTVLVALGVASIPGFARLVRGSVLAAASKDYVAAAYAVGVPGGRVMFRHILPNILGPIIVYATVGLGGAIMMTAGLSYVGLGAQPPSPEWGAMLNQGRSFMRNGWWMSTFPGLAIFAAVLAVNLAGDGLRDALDPKVRRA